MTLSQGQVLNNRYRIVRLLGQGGFGAVYRAWDLQMAEACAVKENLDTSPQAQEQFVREARLLYKLKHPSLPRALDHFTVPGQGQYLVMDYVEGQDLKEIVAQKGALPLDQALGWIGQICDALTYMHTRQPPVIHRDIKPANIKITPDGNAVLVDFGIAKLFDPSTGTKTGARAYTPGYAPPEQHSGSLTDVQSDIFSLGATAWTLLTGMEPPDTNDIFAGLSAAPPPARQLNPQVPEAVSKAVESAMQLKRTERPSSVEQFKAALLQPPSAASAAAPVQAPAPAPVPAPAKVQPIPPTVVQSAASQPPVVQPPVKQPVQQPPLKPPAAVPAKKPSRAWLYVLIGLLVIGGIVAAFFIFKGMSDGGDQPTAQAEVAPTEPPLAPPTEPALGIGSTEVSWTDGMTMVYVPEGPFLMGSKPDDPNTSSQEQPQHEVYLDAYWIDQTEVTNAMYKKCVDDGACQPPRDASSKLTNPYYGGGQFANYPVIHVSWDDGVNYCRWAGKRLPTEAEWEKAARDDDGRTYPWGNQPPNCERANSFNDTANAPCTGDTRNVGSYPAGASPYGALNMAGNVWEWVSDWYQDNYYSSSPSSNPTGPAEGIHRVFRGGSWNDVPYALRASFRNHDDPTSTSDSLGFRCAAPAAQATAAPAAPPSGEPLKIGLLAPVTGAVPAYGQSTLEGAMLAVNEWNAMGGVLGRPIELIIEDSQCEADPAVSAANKLIDQDGVRYLVGEICSKASIPVSEIANARGVVMISPTSTNPAVTILPDGSTKKYVFRAGFIDPFQGRVMAKFARSRGFNNAFVMLDPGNPYVSGLAEAFIAFFKDMGGSIAGIESYLATDQDFSAILSKVKDSGADMLYVPDYYEVVNRVGAQSKAMGYPITMMGGDGWDSSGLDVGAADGGFYSNHFDASDTRPIVQEWLVRYGEAYKNADGSPKVPDAVATLAYDATNLLLWTIQKTGADDPAKVAEVLAGITFDAVSGTINFDSMHNPVKNAVVIGVSGGEKKFIESVAP